MTKHGSVGHARRVGCTHNRRHHGIYSKWEDDALMVQQWPTTQDHAGQEKMLLVEKPHALEVPLDRSLNRMAGAGADHSRYANSTLLRPNSGPRFISDKKRFRRGHLEAHAF